jgi:3-carboxy-cis,cis-muconate cycloisomerase
LGGSRTEVAEVAESAGGSSSAMPQKQNPVLATLLVAAARQAPSYAAMLGFLAEDERPAGAWQSEWQPLRESLRLAGGAAHTAAELAEGLRVFPARLAANLALSKGAIVAERLSVVLGKAATKELLASEGSLDELVDAELLDPAGYLGAAGELVDRVLARHAELLP